MREIKFRAWDDGKKEWLLGYEYPNLGGFSIYGECVLIGEWANVCTAFLFEQNNHKRVDLKLMQFTGLIDKNGNEIYDGDIVLFPDNVKIHIVEYYKSGYVLKSVYGNVLVYNINPIYLEIIGNIHENPELLKP